ncbi:hypothetical protein GWK47_027283 [Chionoecetes opilio]|uniref:PHD-type domain-containing protein n=1 Tax=Chionoecetes opilio TaxID=41210 RepID=A0A8J8WA69_CHIOP|nr:hypothetical protein GWK47_027283 [Chionoecetes opilio]
MAADSIDNIRREIQIRVIATNVTKKPPRASTPRSPQLRPLHSHRRALFLYRTTRHPRLAPPPWQRKRGFDGGSRASSPAPWGGCRVRAACGKSFPTSALHDPCGTCVSGNVSQQTLFICGFLGPPFPVPPPSEADCCCCFSPAPWWCCCPLPPASTANNTAARTKWGAPVPAGSFKGGAGRGEIFALVCSRTPKTGDVTHHLQQWSQSRHREPALGCDLKPHRSQLGAGEITPCPKSGPRQTTQKPIVWFLVLLLGPLSHRPPPQASNMANYVINDKSPQPHVEGDCMIACDACQTWYHRDCEGISSHRWRNLQDYDTTYTCNSCRRFFPRHLWGEKGTAGQYRHRHKSLLATPLLHVFYIPTQAFLPSLLSKHPSYFYYFPSLFMTPTQS